MHKKQGHSLEFFHNHKRPIFTYLIRLCVHMHCIVGTTDFSAKWSKFRPFLPYLVKSCAWFTSPRGDLPWYPGTLAFKHVLGPLKMSAGVYQAGQIMAKSNCQFRKLGLEAHHYPLTWVWPLLFQIPDKRGPGSFQNLTSVLWLVLTTTHYQEPFFAKSRGFLWSKKAL